MSKRTIPPSLSQRAAALIRHWLNVPSREEVRPWREDQVHTHRLWAHLAIYLSAEAGRAEREALRTLRAALDAFGQMEPPR